jgi:glutamate-1-semialdehyde 2,1-aminomutase
MKLAEAIRERVPSCERVRLMSSGTEATSTAVRLARGVTGRDRIVTFAGNYHGATDALLVAGGSGVATLGIPGTAGVPAAAVSQTVVAPYNVVPELDEQVACVIVEPVAANMGVVAPAPGFLEGLREACSRVGALLVFDEVITGFRLARGGFQATSPVRPDLTCFGKVIGGGLPIGAVGGRAEVMEQLSPLGPVFHAGTLSGNPLATAAGLATLDLLDDGAYDQLTATAAALQVGLQAAMDAAGLPVTVPRVGTLVGLHCSRTPAHDYDTARTTDTALYARLFHALLRRGVALAPGAYEALFPGLAHDPGVVHAVVERAADAALEVAAALA